MLQKVSIIDYGMGNIWSVLSAFDYIGAKTKIVTEPEEIYNAECLILPGVGSFKNAIKKIKENSLDEAIQKSSSKGTKILGICLGMQLLSKSSTEDGLNEGLSIVDGVVERFDENIISKEIKIPHIGFNSVTFNQKDKLFKGIKQNSYFYFVHSYRTLSNDNENSFLCSHFKYGKKFISSFSKNNIFGTQFHPEKSQTNGLLLIKNFINS